MKKPSKQQAKFGKVMREFYAGTLKSSSGAKVTSRAQAVPREVERDARTVRLYRHKLFQIA
jgi:hypothetical protein